MTRFFFIVCALTVGWLALWQDRALGNSAVDTGFESGLENWSVEGGVWEVGKPVAVGGPQVFRGAQVAGTGLKGVYGTFFDSRLISPVFVVPPSADHPRLAYNYWYAIGANDYGQLQLRLKGGEWQDVSGERLTEASGGAWARRRLDLRPYAGQEVQVGFRIVGAANNSAGDRALGWFVDEVLLETGVPGPLLPQTFEDGFGEWSVEGGVWQVGPPIAVGGPAPFRGTSVVGTVLGGIYGTTHDARLVTPEFVVPAAVESPRFIYQYWYELGALDYGQLQIRESGGQWVDIAGERLTEALSGSWARRSVDLRAFAGRTIQLGFRLVAAYQNIRGDLALGWYIDDARVETGPQTLLPVEGFESGFGDWSVEGGVWQVGAPGYASAPVALEGRSLAATGLSGSYGTTHDARLVSPEFRVPAGDQFPRFSYDYWYSFGVFDYGQLQYREPGGPWVDVAGERLTESSAGAWAKRVWDLRPLAGKVVQIAFHIVAAYQNRAGDLAAGWYVDRVSVETGPPQLSSVEGFENGFGDWSAEGGLWQVGIPTAAGSLKAFAGQAVAATVLAGHYGSIHDARLVSPEFVVPPHGRNPRLSYFQWYDFGAYDSGTLQIKRAGDEWRDVADEVLSGRSLSWARHTLDLRPYAGQRVQVGFRVVTGYENRAGDLGLGWSLDEVALLTGPDSLRLPEDFESGFGSWSVDGGVWQIGPPTGSGAPSVPSGKHVAGTILDSAYPNNSNARLITPEFIVPPASTLPVLSYLEWRAFTGKDAGRVEVSLAGGPWQLVTEFSSVTDSQWKRRFIELAPFGGRAIRVAWHFVSDANFVSRGWFLDDVLLDAIEPVTLGLGGGTNGFLAQPGSRALYRVDVPSGGHLRFTVDDADNLGVNLVYIRRGQVPGSGSADGSGLRVAADQSVFVPDSGAGPWYVLVVGSSVPTNGSAFQIRTEFFEGIALTQIKPERVGNGFPTTFEILGAGFDSSAAVGIRQDANVLAVGKVTWVSRDKLLAAFDPTGLAPGAYSLEVTQGNAVARMPIEIVPGGLPKLETRLIVPGYVGRHAPATIYVEYSNAGTVAMPAPILLLHGSDGALLSLDSKLAGRGLRTAIHPVGFGDTVQFLGSGSTPGMLQPGETRRTPVYYCGLKQPWDFSDRSVSFRLAAYDSESTLAIDWNTYKSRLRPADVPAEAWDAIWANFVEAVGPDWGGYDRALSRAAVYLGSVGLDVTSVRELLAFELAKANGMNPVAALGTTTDIHVDAPGIALGFTRSYSHALGSRFTSGPLGRGWTHNWQFSLILRPDGSIAIKGPEGGYRLFQPDLRGGFLGMPGDPGKLARRGGGGYLVTEINGSSMAFQPGGLLDYVEDSNGNRITAGHSGRDLVSLIHSSGQFLHFTHEASLLRSVSDASGQQVLFHYSDGNLARAVRAGAGEVVYAYEPPGTLARAHALTNILYPGGIRHGFRYETHGWLESLQNEGCCESETQLLYDSPGNVTFVEPAGERWLFSFNQRGQVARLRDPVGRTLRLGYDALSRLNLLERPDGSSWQRTLDAAGGTVKVMDPNGGVYRLTLGQKERLVRLTDARGIQTQFERDARGNLVSMVQADGRRESYLLDSYGQLLSITNRRGQVVRSLRDQAGRVTLKWTSDGRTNEFQYDGRGNMIHQVDSLFGLTSLSYDERNQLTRIVHPDGNGFEFEYDAAGRRVARKGLDGYSIHYFYGENGRLERLEDGTGRLLGRYFYNANGRLLGDIQSNGARSTNELNGLGQIVRLGNFAPDGTLISQFNYEFDRNGFRTRMETAEGATQYEMDPLGQLKRVQYPEGGFEAFVMDPMGNRLAHVLPSGTNVLGVNLLNQYTQVGKDVLEYDADGNLTNVVSATDKVAFEYDAENRLTLLTSERDGSWRFTYDAFGNRIQVEHAGRRVRRVYDPAGGPTLAAEYEDGVGLVARYAWGLGLIERLAADGSTHTYQFDAMGNTTALLDANGRVVNRYDYSAFGGVTRRVEGVNNPFTFVGRFGVVEDAPSYLQMGRREYAAGIGRFTSPDPIGLLGGANLYRYAINSPVNRVDPSGLESFTIDSPFDLISIGAGWNADTGESFFVFGVGGGLGTTVGVKNSGVSINAATPVGGWGIETGRTQNGCGVSMSYAAGIGQQIDSESSSPTPFDPSLSPSLGLGGQGSFQCAIKLWDDQATDDLKWLWRELLDSLNPPERELDTQDNKTVNSVDPNELVGPAGFGEANYIRADELLSYRINFENAADATAPAQMVVITNRIPDGLDFDTLELVGIGFGEYEFPLTDNSPLHERVERISYLGVDFDVSMEVRIDPEQRSVVALFQSTVPETGLPPEIQIGFLPPEDGTGRGQGHVSYVVKPVRGIKTGTEIRNVADITFDPYGGGTTYRTDLLDPHDPASPSSPARQALVTMDSSPPVALIEALPPIVDTLRVPVRWTGQDEGSGVVSFAVYVREGTADWRLWVGGTTETAGQWDGVAGRTYGFFAVARDGAGLQGSPPDAVTPPQAVVFFERAGSFARVQKAGDRLELELVGEASTEWLIQRASAVEGPWEEVRIVRLDGAGHATWSESIETSSTQYYRARRQ